MNGAQIAFGKLSNESKRYALIQRKSYGFEIEIKGAKHNLLSQIIRRGKMYEFGSLYPLVPCISQILGPI